MYARKRLKSSSKIVHANKDLIVERHLRHKNRTSSTKAMSLIPQCQTSGFGMV